MGARQFYTVPQMDAICFLRLPCIKKLQFISANTSNGSICCLFTSVWLRPRAVSNKAGSSSSSNSRSHPCSFDAAWDQSPRGTQTVTSVTYTQGLYEEETEGYFMCPCLYVPSTPPSTPRHLTRTSQWRPSSRVAQRASSRKLELEKFLLTLPIPPCSCLRTPTITQSVCCCASRSMAVTVHSLSYCCCCFFLDFVKCLFFDRQAQTA